jgi:hypothetical protein
MLGKFCVLEEPNHSTAPRPHKMDKTIAGLDLKNLRCNERDSEN